MFDHGIQYKKLQSTRVASKRTSVQKREDIHQIIQELKKRIPSTVIKGPAFCFVNYVTSVKEGIDVEVGFPIDESFMAEGVNIHILPESEVLSITHEGDQSKRPETYQKLFGLARSMGILSDEFSREVFLDADNPFGNQIEVQLFIHNWNRRMESSLKLILGEKELQEILKQNISLTIESTMEDRYSWAYKIINTLDQKYSDQEKYDILCGCSHRFPTDLIQKMHETYENAIHNGKSPYEAIDSTLQFMDEDHGWDEAPKREGNILYTSKNPANPEAFKIAKTPEERRKAYCFCSIIKNHLEDGMSPTFCYCGAGWVRQQWEGVFLQPIKIDLVKSLLKGDEECKFAIHIPENL